MTAKFFFPFLSQLERNFCFERTVSRCAVQYLVNCHLKTAETVLMLFQFESYSRICKLKRELVFTIFFFSQKDAVSSKIKSLKNRIDSALKIKTGRDLMKANFRKKSQVYY